MKVVQSRQRRPAFTLVELLVVIAIIAMLAALLLPSLHRARERGRRAVCQSNLKQTGMLCYLYADDYRGSYPISGAGRQRDGIIGIWACDPISGLGWLSRPLGGHPSDSPTYTKDVSIFYCPNVIGLRTSSQAFLDTPKSNWFLTPVVCRVGYFYWGNPWVYDQLGSSCLYTAPHRSATANLRPANGYALAPGRLELAGKADDALVLAMDFVQMSPIDPDAARILLHPRDRPPEGGNLLFSDGHVQFLTWNHWSYATGANDYWRPASGY